MSTLKKIFWAAVTFIIGLSPLWIYLTVRFLFEPKGFWQEIVLVGLGVWLLGAIQIIALIIMVVMIFLLWVSP